MSKIELNKSYNSSQITESGEKWTDFEGFQGSEVELFLKDKLEDSVVNFEYHNTDFTVPGTGEKLNNILEGKNAFGKTVCYTRIINADPTYTANFSFANVTVGAATYNAGTSYGNIQVNKSDNLTAATTFTYLLTGNIAGSEYNETSPQNVTFKWFKDQQGLEVDATLDTLTRSITPGENVVVDITKMFESSFAGRYLGAVVVPPNKNAVEVVTMFDSPFTLRKLDLSYNGPLVIRNDSSTNTCILTNINLDGTAGDDMGTYKLEYCVDSVNRTTVELDSSTSASQITLTLNNLSEGAHDVYVRAFSAGGNLSSNYIQISFIYQKTVDSALIDAVAMVSEVPDTISNCNLSKFFRVVHTDKISGNIEIVALKSSSQTSLAAIKTMEDARASKYVFKEINMSLLSTDESGTGVEYTSYIEVPGNEDTTEYLKIMVKDGTGTRSLYYYNSGNNTIKRADYKTISVTNPKEGSVHLQYTTGELLGFSQISNGNVFTDLSDSMDSSDGLQLESITEGTSSVTMTAFKVSPTTGVFKTPKKLVSAGQTALHKGAFSIEMMFKTYGIADLEDKIMTIGNITLCPKHIFLNYLPNENKNPDDIVNASRADFRKEVIQHVMITYDPNYKPSTYDNIYDMFYASGSTKYTTDAAAFPCFKVYVNGTINRVISVGSGTICEENDFKMQIHPSNSNVNFYIFRTYDKALNFEEVKKNYISSIPKLSDKQDYYLDNDILYTSSDFSAGQLSEKAKILNTISLGKCINKFRSVSNPNKQYKDRRVLLVALADGILPPYYGNRKDSEPKAAFLVHYPEVLTDSGYAPSTYSGVLNGGKVKAQGSSAKKYMFHNTSYSKFKFIPETEARNAKNENRDAKAVSYYQMPGSDIKIEKLVGKVNYASSMQSHKQGATKLFHEAYVASGLDTTWMNGGRKAVLEDDFLYFFVNVPKDDLATITWDYFKQEDGTYNFENCYFLGFQTWGSAKGDKPTSGYSKATPHYLMFEGADNDSSVANFKTPWASMQLWGNYKGGSTWESADSTDISAPSSNPETGKNYYHQFAGGTNKSKATNLDPHANIWEPEYLTGLLINDETVVFNPGTESENSSDKRADALDVDFGCTEGDGYQEKGNWYLDGEEVDEDTPGAVKATKDNLFFVFEKEAQPSVNRFAQFYNLVYTFDFSSLLYIPYGTEIDGLSMTVNNKVAYKNKLVFGAGCTIKYGNKTVTPKAGDIYRWEKAWPSDIMANSEAKWVPAGLYHNGTDWESLNITTICSWYVRATLNRGTYPSEYSFFAKPDYENLRARMSDTQYRYIMDSDYEFTGIDEDGSEFLNLQGCMAEAFKIVMYEFLDINDFSYHSAFIKLVAGTDNRAKNTYFQIIGPIYTNKATVEGIEGEVSLVKISSDDEYNKKPGFIKDGVFYFVSVDGDVVTVTGDPVNAEGLTTKDYYYKQTGFGDNKIRMYADDLDTIFKTDNNGQQVKHYYLMEPPFNRDLEELWGDMHSGLFYNFDITCTDEVKTQLAKLLEFSTGNEWPDTSSTKFHDYFFSIQKAIPSIAYNHQSEIYYESPQVLWQGGNPTALYDIFEKGPKQSSWKDFNNNKVTDPVSLSHGSCLEAEVEYLRDRVLLLSTYVNKAKNKTDVGIQLKGGSATTQGSEIVISSDYTSFIQYIYPIINNISSSKETTGLDYDPLIDVMKYNRNTGGYDKIDLVYNVALPNEPVDMNVKFATSGLTTNSYWTSTDLYRTIWIKRGTEAFSSLFAFPNASTVISQDSAYKIDITEGKEIEVVESLESIEHLVLQNATINSSGFDFTGCNRLKTLVLGKTEDNLTDSPEGTPEEDIKWYAVKFTDVLDPTKYIKTNAAEASTGFRQIILPNSNSVEQVILPSCVKIANINHYPNLTRFEFNAGTELTNLTIDGRNPNKIIEYILTNFVGTYTTNLEITNLPDNFWLTEATCRKLTQIANVKMNGTVNIGDGVNKAEIDWTTKRMLVEKFGNITTGTLVFSYKEVTTLKSDITANTTGTIESSGLAPVQLSIKGNTIPIASDNKHLRITYKITDSDKTSVPPAGDIRFVDEYTPQLVIKEGLKGIYDITTTVYYAGSSTPATTKTKITVGFYTPQVGDFAYANGSFSSVCDPSQGLVGIVFYSNASTNGEGKKVHDVRILSANYSSTDVPMGPSKYALNYYNSTSKKLQHEKYISLLGALGLDADTYMTDVVQSRTGGDATTPISYDSKWNGVSGTDLADATLPNTVERINQKEYIRRAEQFIFKLRGKSGFTVTGLELDDFDKPTAAGKANFEQALTEINSMLNIEAGTSSYSSADCGGFNFALYPAFLKALYYAPNLELTGKGETYFGIGNWYVPDTREIERIIYYRINSSISDTASSKFAWNNTSASGKDVSGKGRNKFNADAFANITFLKDTGAQVTSFGTNEGACQAYGTLGYWGDSEPQWSNSVSEGSSTACARDVSHNITPVCRVELIES